MQIPGGPSLATSHNIVIVNDEDIKDARCDVDAKQDVDEIPSPLLDSVEIARQHADHSILMAHEMELDAHHEQEDVPAFDHMLSLSFANSPEGDVPDRRSLSSEMKLVPPLKQQSSVSHMDHDEKDEKDEQDQKDGKDEQENVSYQDVFALMSAPQRSIPRDHARQVSLSHASSIDSVEAPRSAPPALPSVAAPNYPPSQSRQHIVKLHSQRIQSTSKAPLISAASPTSSGKYPSRSVASASQSRLVSSSSQSHHIHSPSHADSYTSRQQQRLAKMEAKYEGEDYIADLMSHSDDDDDDEEEKVVQKHVAKMSVAGAPPPQQQPIAGLDMGFAQLDQPIRIPKQYDMHWWALILMIIQVMIYAADIIMNGILIYYYWQHGFWPSAICLLTIRGIASLMSIIFDYVNRGTCAFLPFHLLQARILLEASYYLTEWLHHRRRKWTHSEFRAAYAFENFIVSMPSLIIQTYVLILQSNGPSAPSEIWTSSFEVPSTTAALISSTPSIIQIISICITAIAASIDLYHYYRYISVPQWIYITMMCKGIYTTFVRTFVMALLIHAFGVYFLFFWLGLSYLAGWFLYIYALHIADRRARDNPLASRWCHAIVGHQVAQTMMFVSLPFATSHSVEDWWVGYLVSDIKIHLDTGLLIALVTWRTDKDATIWICFVITMMMMMINMYVLVIMHRIVQPYIIKRALFSTTLIVKLYATMCVHLKSRIYGIAKEDEFQQRLPHHKVRLASRPSNPQSQSQSQSPMRKVQERARSVMHAGRDLVSLAQGQSPRFADDPIMVQPEDIGLNVPNEVG